MEFVLFMIHITLLCVYLSMLSANITRNKILNNLELILKKMEEQKVDDRK